MPVTRFLGLSSRGWFWVLYLALCVAVVRTCG